MTDAQMLALVKTARGEGFVELREVPVPKIGSGEVLIEVKAVGICGTDIHIYHDQHRYWPPCSVRTRIRWADRGERQTTLLVTRWEIALWPEAAYSGLWSLLQLLSGSSGSMCAQTLAWLGY